MKTSSQWLPRFLRLKADRTKSGNQCKKRKPFQRSMQLERLEDRSLLVVSIGNPTPIVEPGTGFDGVVKIWVNRGGNQSDAGTGVLLSDGQHVLTAAHVIVGDVFKGTYDPVSDRRITVEFYIPNHVGDSAMRFEVPFDSSHIVSAGYNGNLLAGNDLLVLDLGVLAPIGPKGYGAERYGLFSGNPDGKTVSMVGYGRWGQGDSGSTMVPPGGFGGGIKHGGVNQIDLVGWNKIPSALTKLGLSSPTGLYMDFDNPVHPTSLGDIASAVKYNVLAPANSGFAIPNESLAAQGDSGGPQFIDGMIAGVTSYSIPAPYNVPAEALNPELGSRFGDVGVVEAVKPHLNGLNAILNSPKVITLDMNRQYIPADAEIEVRRASGDVEIYVNWKSGTTPTRSLWYAQPAASLSELRFTGFAAGNLNTVTIAAELGIAVRVNGAKTVKVDALSANVSSTVDTTDGWGVIQMTAGARGTSIYHSDVGSVLLLGNNNDSIQVNQSINTRMVISEFKEVNLGTGQGTMGILSPIVIYGTNQTNVTIDDSGDTLRRSIGIRYDSIAGLTPTKITLGSLVRSLKIKGSPAGNGFTVFNTASTVGKYDLIGGDGADTMVVAMSNAPIYFDGLGGSNTVTIGERSSTDPFGAQGPRSMQAIQGNIYITSANGQTDLNVDDSASTDARSVVLNRTAFNSQFPYSITGLSPLGSIVYYNGAAMASISINTGAGPQNVKILDTASRKVNLMGQPLERLTTTLRTGIANSQFYVSGTTGNLDILASGSIDTAEFGTAQKSLDNIFGEIQIAGRFPNSLRVSTVDTATSRTIPIVMQPGKISIAGQTNIRYSFESSVSVVTSDRVEVQDTRPGFTTSVNSPNVRIFKTTGPMRVETQDRRVQQVEIGNAAGTLDSIQGEINISTYAAASGSKIVINDYGTASNEMPQNVFLSKTEFRRPGAAPISYADGLQNPFFTIPPKAMTTYIGGPQATAMHVGGNMFERFSFIAGTVFDGLTVHSDDNGSLEGIHDVSFGGRGGNNGLVLDDSGSTTDKTYEANSATMSPSTINVGTSKFSYSSVPTVHVKTTTGNAVANVRKATPGSMLIFSGGSGNNRVIGPNDATDIWEIYDRDTAILTVGVLDVARFIGFSQFNLGSGDDRVQMDPSGSLSGRLDGGSGNNTLTYELWEDDVYANAKTGVATSIDGRILGFQRFIGGAGNDILVGNALLTVLDGGAGDDLLIAGISPATLIGGLGMDVLIAGTTSFDNNQNQLRKVLDKWLSDGDYAARVANIQSGNGPSLNGSTVQSNLGPNVLRGDRLESLPGNDEGFDLFFAKLSQDSLLDLDRDWENVIPLA